MIYFDVLAAGLAQGVLVAALAIGVVLTYRGSGVVNFAHGAIAMYAAYVFASVSGDGHYPIPPLPNPLALVEGIASWIGLEIDLPSFPAFLELSAPSPWLAFVIAVLTIMALGLILHFGVFRPLRGAPPLAASIASVGIFIAIQGIVVRRFGSEVQPIRSLLPTSTVELFGVTLTVDRLVLLAVTAVAAAALAFVFARTRFGLKVRAVAENERVAVLLGLSPSTLSGMNWVLATLLAGTVGILASPSSGLDPSILPFLIVPALAAAVLGGLKSFGVAAVGGVAIACAQSLVVYFQTSTWWPRGGTGVPVGGARDLIPLVVIVAALAFRGQALPSRGMAERLRMPRAPLPRHPVRNAIIVNAVLIPVVLFLLSSPWRQALVNSLLAAVICLSLVVVTGYVGQISLCQVALAGVSAFTLTKVADATGLPFPLAPLLGATVAAAVGVLIGIPALRIRGVSLAIATLAAAVAIETTVFSNEFFTGGVQGVTRLELPEIFGVGFGPGDRFRDGKLPGPFFVVFALIVTTAMFLAVANVRRSAWGRRFLAVRENERAAAASGVGVTEAKLVAFGLSAFVAGIGGALSAYRFGNISPTTFGAFSSLLFLGFAYMGGIASLAGAVVAGLVATEGIGPHMMGSVQSIDELIFFLGGVGLVATAVVHPGGIAGRGQQVLERLKRRRPQRHVDSLTDSLELPVEKPKLQGPVNSNQRVEVE